MWNVHREGLTVDSVPIVWEFIDIFPTDQPDLYPDRDIDFFMTLSRELIFPNNLSQSNPTCIAQQLKMFWPIVSYDYRS